MEDNQVVHKTPDGLIAQLVERLLNIISYTQKAAGSSPAQVIFA